MEQNNDENEEKEKAIKIKLNTVVIIAIIFIVIVASVVIILEKEKTNVNIVTSEETVENTTMSDETYYYTHNYYDYKEVSCTYSDEYDIQYLLLDKTKDLSSFEVCEYMNYSDYIEYCKEWNLEQKYNYENYNYIMFSYYLRNENNYNGTNSIEAELAGLKYKDYGTILYIWDGQYSYCDEYVSAAYVITIPTANDSNQVSYISCINSLSYSALTTMNAKPIIYLYPTKETEVMVSLGNSDLITCSYPEYKNYWSVLAYPNGDLLDLTTNRSLYSLYYESTNAIEFKVEDEGFVIAEDDTAKFLEEKLAILGLSERETEEFIIYWLPRLQENEYNYIRFATSEEIEANMPLNIDPEPDTLIRVLMTYKGLDEPIEVVEQELETPERTGSVAVEWGGTEIQ